MDIPDAKKRLASLPEAIDSPHKRRELFYGGLNKVLKKFEVATEARGLKGKREMQVCARAFEMCAPVCAPAGGDQRNP